MDVNLRLEVSHSPHLLLWHFSQQDKTRMVKNCRQDEIQESQEEKDEDGGGGAGDANHGAPGKRGGRRQQGGLHSQSAGLWQGESAAAIIPPKEGALRNTKVSTVTYLGCKSTGGQRSGELHDKRPGRHDGIQAVVRDVARGPLGCHHPSSEF